jgi:hypothetical protein
VATVPRAQRKRKKEEKNDDEKKKIFLLFFVIVFFSFSSHTRARRPHRQERRNHGSRLCSQRRPALAHCGREARQAPSDDSPCEQSDRQVPPGHAAARSVCKSSSLSTFPFSLLFSSLLSSLSIRADVCVADVRRGDGGVALFLLFLSSSFAGVCSENSGSCRALAPPCRRPLTHPTRGPTVVPGCSCWCAGLWRTPVRAGRSVPPGLWLQTATDSVWSPFAGRGLTNNAARLRVVALAAAAARMQAGDSSDSHFSLPSFSRLHRRVRSRRRPPLGQDRRRAGWPRQQGRCDLAALRHQPQPD